MSGVLGLVGSLLRGLGVVAAGFGQIGGQGDVQASGATAQGGHRQRVGVEADQDPLHGQGQLGLQGAGQGVRAIVLTLAPELGELIVLLCQHVGDGLFPVGGVFGLCPFTPAPAVVGHGQIGQQGRLDQPVHHGIGPGDGDGVDAAHHVVAPGQTGTPQGAQDAAGDHAASQGEAPGQQVGLQARQCAGDQTAHDGCMAFVEILGHVVVIGHAAEHLVGGMAHQTVGFDQLVGGLADGGVETLGQLGHGLLLGIVLRRARDAQHFAHLAQLVLQAAVGNAFAVQRGGGQPGGQDVHRAVEGLAALVLPQAVEPTEGGLLGLKQQRLDGLQQGAFLNPAAGKGIQGQHLMDVAEAGEVGAPAVDLGFFGLVAGRGAHLVQQHDDGLADPGQDLHFGFDVAGILGVLGRVDQVQHHVGFFTDVVNGLLAGPQGAVSEAVPDLADEPANGAVGLQQAPRQSGAVAETGGVPQDQLVALRSLGQLEAVVGVGDVRLVAHLAHALREQGAGKGGLADVGVGDQAEGDDVGGVGHGDEKSRGGSGAGGHGPG